MRIDVRERAGKRARSFRVVGNLACLVVAGGFGAAAHAIPGPANCTALLGMAVQSGTVTAVDRFAQGSVIQGSGGMCRVKMVLTPTQSSSINIEAWLPETWNNKMFTYGGGGFSGGLGQSAKYMNTALGTGYASATSDLGHPTSSSATWALNQPEKVIDFGHRGNHLVAVTAKQVMNAYYQLPVQRAYFQGCSDGGREALGEVIRYPGDYNGVIAGASANYFGEQMAFQVWTDRLRSTVPNLNWKLSAVNTAVMNACDALDGVKDGKIENPKACNWDPAAIQCTLFDTTSCLNATEVAVMRKFYDGPRLATGELVYSGRARGSEGGWASSDLLNTAGGQEYFRNFVYNNPNWSESNFNIDVDVPYSRTYVEPNVNADNPDIRPFIQAGGKLIMYHGWADQEVPSANSVRFYEAASNIVGSSIGSNARLFMDPGTQHTCEDGINLVPHLEAWVENGVAPTRIIKTTTSGTTTITHPLCPWPQTAKYNGSGSTTDAANFTCQ